MTTFAQPRSASGLEGHAARVKDDMTKLIRHAAATSVRSQQTRIGPSEMGHPCMRKLAYKALDHPKTNTGTDPLPSIIGTGGHLWLADAIERVGNGRYLSETRLNVSGTHSGHCDVLDTWTRTSSDFKFPGPTAMKKCNVEEPGAQYRRQGHLYGLGWHNLGYTPEHVAIIYIPRAGRLEDMHVWSEPWSQQLAEECLNRYASIVARLGELNADTDRSILARVPITPTNCAWCEWFLLGSNDPAAGCPGDLKVR
jgi:hypothetical protein